jgi:Fe-S-cluster containining protein
VKVQPCQQCGKCCETQPCALAPEDLPKIAKFLGLTEEQLFKRFLILDYVEGIRERNYYVAPARKNDLTGRIAETGWTFENNACIFLRDRKCSIDRVKPKGGREFYCSLITTLNSNVIGYGKKESVQDWKQTSMLSRLIILAAQALAEGTG